MPIAYTVLIEPVLQHRFRLGNVIAAVDAANGARQLDSFPESVKQAAVADRIVLTKTDLCEAGGIAALKDRLGALNRAAPVHDAAAAACPNGCWSKTPSTTTPRPARWPAGSAAARAEGGPPGA